MRLFRSGSEDAFRVIHDRYRTRLLAYARQMLGAARADAEDVLQDVFVRAYAALRADRRDVSLRAWLYRIAHNRCIDELRRPASGQTASAEALELLHAPGSDPMAAVEQRESLQRLVADVQRLPEQQRSALLMREISGMAYQDLAAALDVTVPAVKSLLVRARIGLVQASEARDTACAAIRADLASAHERGVRASGLVRRHLNDCGGCRAYKRELKALDARLAALVPAVGPVALVAKLLGVVGGGGGLTGGGAGAAGGGAATVAGVGTAAVAGGASVAGVSVSHVAAVVAVAVVGAGGAVEVQKTLAPHAQPAVVQHVTSAPASATPAGTRAESLLPGLRGARGADAVALRMRIAPAAVVVAEPVVEVVPADGTTPPATGTGNGGAAAPVEPTLEPVLPETPPAPPAANPESGSAGGSIGSAGSTGTPPPPPASEPAPPAASEPPPATSPVPAAPPAATAPPTSASTGGAAYAPRR